MSYVRKVCLPGEEIVYEARLHWVAYLPVFWLVVLWAVCFWLLLGRGDIFWIANAIFAVFAGLILFASWLHAVSTELVVTDKRVIAKTGFIRRSSHEIARHKIEGVAVDQSLAGRMLGFGTVTVRGTGGGLAPMPQIADPLAFRNAVSTEIDKEGAAVRAMTAAPPPVAG